MGYDLPDAYNQPEHFGLTLVGELNHVDPDDGYNMLVLWQHDDGRLFYARDAGCPEPPFESTTSLNKLTEVNRTRFHQFEEAVSSHPADAVARHALIQKASAYLAVEERLARESMVADVEEDEEAA